MSALAAVPAGARVVDRRSLPPIVARTATFAALALFTGLRWGSMQEPHSRGRLVACTAIALAAAAAAHRTRALVGRERLAALAAIATAGFFAVLLAAGVPLDLLRPDHWDALASSLAQAVETLPTIGVPYRGVDPWIHIVLIAGGGLLLVLAALLAVRALHRGSRPLGAAVVLTTAYVIPIVEREQSQPFVSGTIFALLAGALLWADRIERGNASAAAVFLVVAVIGALLAAPRLDAAEPWVDYQAIVQSLSTPPSVGFDWDHGYGPLDWPRENRVMARIASDRPHYWKAVDLETFDGTRWTTSGRVPPGQATEVAPNHADWVVKLRVSVRDLRSTQYLTAGSGIKVENSPRFAVASAPGVFTTGRQSLRRGDSYSAEVYVPNPSVREMRAAGTQYPPLVLPYLQMDMGAADAGNPFPEGGVRSLTLEFPQFSVLSARTPPGFLYPSGGSFGDAGPVLEGSGYAPMYALARRLRHEATTPYEYISAVQARLAKGYAYSEAPPRPRPGRPPLVSFLFDSREGYCQQFSGAMALLLRMGGVPARVSSGFSPGTFDEGRDEWVVRDLDAHSWVEAYFPNLGWVTFDPTPGVAPPHTQLFNGPAPADAEEIPLRSDGRQGDFPTGGAPGAGGAPAAAGGVSPWAVAGIVAGAGALGSLVLVAWRRRRPGAQDGPPELAELLRALRVTGREVEPGLTLQALERRFGSHAPGASAYVVAVRLARYGGRAQQPSPEQRAALRTELAAGLGWTGRLRAWWALPPSWQRP